jgi:hypothetical protein
MSNNMQIKFLLSIIFTVLFFNYSGHAMNKDSRPNTSIKKKRTKNACDNCKKTKHRCSNEQPCWNCAQEGLECVRRARQFRAWDFQVIASSKSESSSETMDEGPSESQIIIPPHLASLRQRLCDSIESYENSIRNDQIMLGQMSSYSSSERYSKHLHYSIKHHMKCLSIARLQLKELESSLTQPLIPLNIEPTFVEHTNGFPPPSANEASPHEKFKTMQANVQFSPYCLESMGIVE